MADLWNEFPAEPGTLAGAVARQVAMHVPLAPAAPQQHPQYLQLQQQSQVAVELEQPQLRPLPYRDPLEWMLLKHVVQAALVASVVLVVLHGGSSPFMALGYAATGLLLMGVMVIADRQRFNDRDPAFEIVEVIAPEPAPAQPAPSVRQGPLVPIVEQMQGMLPERVDVT